MGVSRGQVIGRGFTLRCPNCGGWTLLAGPWRMRERCIRCGLTFERDDGFFWGAITVNYFITMTILLVPLLVLVFTERLSVPAALLIGVGWCILFPIAFYGAAKSLWLMLWYVTFPNDLPGNGGSR